VRIIKIFIQVLLGTAISLVAQYAGLILIPILKIPDPAFAFLYSSLGLLASFLFGTFFVLKKQWAFLIGVVAGVLLWWPFMGLIMGLTGSWL